MKIVAWLVSMVVAFGVGFATGIYKGSDVRTEIVKFRNEAMSEIRWIRDIVLELKKKL